MGIEYDVSCDFAIYGLHYVEICSLYTHFAESLFLSKMRVEFYQIFIYASINMFL